MNAWSCSGGRGVVPKEWRRSLFQNEVTCWSDKKDSSIGKLRRPLGRDPYNNQILQLRRLEIDFSKIYKVHPHPKDEIAFGLPLSGLFLTSQRSERDFSNFPEIEFLLFSEFERTEKVRGNILKSNDSSGLDRILESLLCVTTKQFNIFKKTQLGYKMENIFNTAEYHGREMSLTICCFRSRTWLRIPCFW